MAYFDKFTNVHRLASEHLLAAVTLKKADPLLPARECAEQARRLADDEFERTLADGILSTIAAEQRVFDRP